MKKAKTSKIGIVLGTGLIVIFGIMAVKAADTAMNKPVKETTMKEIHESAMKCTVNFEKNMKDTSDVMGMLDEAVKALDAGNTAGAKEQIEKARKLLNEMNMTQKKNIAKLPTVNDRCPITGNQIDMMNTPENLTRIHKGQKVGFCCPNCPPVWDKLTEKEKDEKLAKVIDKVPDITPKPDPLQ